jgi:DNA modification methylase
MPEGLAEFFVRACSPADGVVVDPFAGSGTTTVVARRLGRRAGGLEVHKPFVAAGQERLRLDEPDNTIVLIDLAR